MNLHGRNIIACATLDANASGVVNPAGYFSARGNLAAFEEADERHIQLAFEAAAKDFESVRKIAPEQRAAFLDRIGDEILALGNDLLTAANTETSLPVEIRLFGERARTVNQLKLFAELIREGSWVDARID